MQHHLLPFVGLLILLASTQSASAPSDGTSFAPREYSHEKRLIEASQNFLTQSELKLVRRGFSMGGLRPKFGIFDF